MSVYLCVCISNEVFALSLLNNTESLKQGQNEGYCIEIFNRALEGIKSLAPSDLNWPTQQTVLQISLFINQCPETAALNFMVSFRKLLSTSVLAAFSQWYTHVSFWLKDMDEYIILRLQICISLSHEGLLHGKSKASFILIMFC